MITFLEGFKYLAAVIVALSVPGFGLVAFSFLAFWWLQQLPVDAVHCSRNLHKGSLGFPFDIGCADPRSQTRDLGHPSHRFVTWSFLSQLASG
jgi:hypothetical protein